MQGTTSQWAQHNEGVIKSYYDNDAERNLSYNVTLNNSMTTFKIVPWRLLTINITSN